MALPLIISGDQSLDLIQTRWKSQLDPVLSNRLTQGLLLSQVAIVTGSNVINHLLDRNQQGWFITDINAAAQLYRSAPLNDKTLTLTSDAPCIISLWVF